MSLVENENEQVIINKVHFTYKEQCDTSSLCQGDLLKITDELKDVLKDVHPYFLNEHLLVYMCNA